MFTYKETDKRLLTVGEINLALAVFADSLPYKKVWIANYFFLGSDCPMTIASAPFNRLTTYTIYWKDSRVFHFGADQCGAVEQATLIHELVHVWQGHNSLCSQTYMLKSVVAQGIAGIKDIIKMGAWCGWNNHRRRAYDYIPGRAWNQYNVEQQARIIEDWFSSDPRNIDAGYQDKEDIRYRYVVNNIRTGNSLCNKNSSN
jgi:hypothetical protein